MLTVYKDCAGLDIMLIAQHEDGFILGLFQFEEKQTKTTTKENKYTHKKTKLDSQWKPSFCTFEISPPRKELQRLVPNARGSFAQSIAARHTGFCKSNADVPVFPCLV